MGRHVVASRKRRVSQIIVNSTGRACGHDGMELFMNQVQVDQKTYEMPPKDGITVAHFLIVTNIQRSLQFYEKVFGAKVLSRGDSKGAPGYLQLANTWLIVNVGGGPTPDKPTVTLSVPRRSRSSEQLHEHPRGRYSGVL